jgi:hypothetical protein
MRKQAYRLAFAFLIGGFFIASAWVIKNPLKVEAALSDALRCLPPHK